MTRPDGSYLDYTYDDARRLTRIADNLGERIDYTLDAMGDRTATATRDAGAAIVRSQSAAFDELGRLLRSIGAGSQTTIYGYDNNGNVTTIADPLSHQTGQAYDALNRLITTTDPASGTIPVAYDARDNATQVKDQRNLATNYVYDGLNNLIQATSPDTGVTVYLYDAAGNLTQATDACGVVTQYAYDALNRLVSKTYPAAAAENVGYSYDATTGGNKGVGRLTGFTDQSGSTAYVYDERGNAVQETRVIGGLSYVTAYAYDLADNLTQITYPSGRIVSYARDSLGRVTGVTTKANAAAPAVTVASGLAYLPFGPLTGLTFGNGLTLARSFDSDYRLTAQSAASTGATAQALGFGYDLASNITTLSDSRVPARSQSFGYNSRDQLQQAVGVYGQLDYTYDGVGNRLTQALTGTGAFSESYAYPAASNRLNSVTRGASVRPFTYTASGQADSDNRAVGANFTYTYNNAGRLVQAGRLGVPDAAYIHNALGERVVKALPGTPPPIIHYHYGRDGMLLAESDGAGIVQQEYIWLDGMPLAQVFSGALYFVHADHLGTAQAITDATQAIVWEAAYTPFGETASASGSFPNNLRFPGQYFDAETGTHYNYQRSYDPSIGRYVQSDPIGLHGGINTYTYVSNNPTRFSDRLGLLPSSESSTSRALNSSSSPSDNIKPALPQSKSANQQCALEPDALRCRQVKNQCIAECSGSSLPSGDHGFRFWNCLNACMARHGC